MAEQSRITRRQLKEIVKECLIEILSEGLGSLQHNEKNVRVESRVRRQPASRPRSAALDTPIGRMGSDHQASKRQPTQALVEAINMEARGNDIMRDILADTATTTLPKMIEHNDANPRPQMGTSATTMQQEHFAGNPDEVFGDEVSSKWAALAFEMPVKK